MTQPCLLKTIVKGLRSLLAKSLSFILLMGSVWTIHAEEVGPPNIVILLADDLGWEDLPSYGNKAHRTPHLDALAAAGLRFTAAYAAPTCSPARASLLTGKAPARLGLTDFISGKLGGSVPNPKGQGYPYPERSRLIQPDMTNPGLALTETTLAEALREGGYTTGFVGKWHLGATGPGEHGFDWVREVTENGQPTFQGDEFMTVTKTRAAREFIETQAPSGEPFFLYLSYNAIHTPIDATEDRIAEFAGAPWPELAAMLSHLDDSVGEVTAALEAAGVAENTVVVFVSDNGAAKARAKQFRGLKGHLYEGGIRVPMIVRGPGQAPGGSETQALVHVADLYPTLLDLAGLSQQHDQHKDGVSFAPVLTDPEFVSRDSLAWHYPHWFRPDSKRDMFPPASVFREGSWKLFEFLEDGRLELYDLSEDLEESENLAGQYPERVTAMRKRLAAWRDSVAAQMPVPKTSIEAPAENTANSDD